VATFGRRPLIDHDNLEEYADPVDYDRHRSSDTGGAEHRFGLCGIR
jgi:hypothetical protein